MVVPKHPQSAALGHQRPRIQDFFLHGGVTIESYFILRIPNHPYPFLGHFRTLLQIDGSLINLCAIPGGLSVESVWATTVRQAHDQHQAKLRKFIQSNPLFGLRKSISFGAGIVGAIAGIWALGYDPFAAQNWVQWGYYLLDWSVSGMVGGFGMMYGVRPLLLWVVRKRIEAAMKSLT